MCYSFHPFQKEGQEFVLWQLTVELNCIFFFRCDLDKQMLSRQISILCQTAVCWGLFWGTGLQNEATSYVLSLYLRVWSLTSICWMTHDHGTQLGCHWCWIKIMSVHLSNGATLWMGPDRCFSFGRAYCYDYREFFSWGFPIRLVAKWSIQ